MQMSVGESSMEAAGDSLVWECRLYARYLVGRDATPEVVQRYRRASEIMFESESNGSPIVEFVRRNPWALRTAHALC